MTDNTTYKVLRRTTEGWTLVDNLNAVHLTKEQCDQVLMNLVNEGINPNDLKAVKDN